MNINRLQLLLSIPLLTVVLSCSEGDKKSTAQAQSNPECTFTNPIMKGADPWVVKRDEFYYFIESKGGGIHVSKSEELTKPKNWKEVWTPSRQSSGWNQANIWAPELHYIKGKWYIYYAASAKPGPPYVNQRTGILESVSDDPQGKYIDQGMLYTGDNFKDQTNNIWAIDLTVFTLNDQLYALWSGKERNGPTKEVPQQLYIAKMKNPTTMGNKRVMISDPGQKWEIGIKHDINEGPEVLRHQDNIFVIYSARESWLRHYKLGMLKLKKSGSDPMNPDNWIKSGPVFQSTNEVFGTGHASFTQSPDNTENWIVYHAKKDTTPGWGNRYVNMKPFTWNDNGTPNFGEPVPTGQKLSRPSGECE